MTEELNLGFGLRFADLYRRDGLVRLDGAFVDALKTRRADLHNRLMAARAAPDEVAGKAESELVVELAPVSRISSPSCSASAPICRRCSRATQTLAPLYTVKRLFVQRRAAKKLRRRAGGDLRRTGAARRA